MTKDREEMIGILKAHSYKKRQIEQLRFELAHPAEIGGDELIAGLALAGRAPGEGGARGGHVSDRTLMIAMRYEGMAENLNAGTVALIARELRALEAETERLEHYVSLLDERQSALIRLHFFESVKWPEIGEALNMSKRSFFYLRETAINELVSMYGFISKLRGTDDEDRK
jgi:hypothetical protein